MLPLWRHTSETTEHLFTCPALREEHNTLSERTDRIFKKWSIPYSALGHLPNLSIKSHWINILQKNCPKIRSHSHSQVRRCNNLSKITGKLIKITDTKPFLTSGNLRRQM